MTEAEQARVALDEIAKAWAACRQQGVGEHVLRTATLTAALANFVGETGEEVTAQIVGMLPDKIRRGDFSQLKAARPAEPGVEDGCGCDHRHDHGH